MRKLLVLSCLSLAFAVGAAPPEQFRPELKGMRIYARGADDTKVVALAAAQILARLNGKGVRRTPGRLHLRFHHGFKQGVGETC